VSKLRYFAFLLIASILFIKPVAADLKITTSADEDSNRVSSFIVVPTNRVILEGIKRDTSPTKIPQQIPFTAQLTDELDPIDILQWEVRIMDKAIGRIKVISNFKGSYINIKPGRLWRSDELDATVKQRTTFVFKPNTQPHQPPLYKKGRSTFGTRQKYGGGTTGYNDYIYNPRLSYTVSAKISRSGKNTKTYSADIRQDDLDLLRQEYINHYGRSRYGFGDNGNIPIPKRDELIEPPRQQNLLSGETFSQSIYSVMVEDGVIELAEKIALAFEQKREQLKQQQGDFVDLHGNTLPITENKPWLSSGWRNPERNEWYSNAINGIHQRGAAIDLIPNEQPGTRQSAATYWLLWQTLNDKKFKLEGFWQLESLGRPLKRIEYNQDIKPENGIPDAFDIADHLHIQLEAPDE
jgi:hypothetical protein